MTCHLCGTALADAPVVGDVSRHGHPSRRVACVRCGLVQVSPQPDRAELLAYYRERYRQEYAPLPIATGDGPIAPDHPAYLAVQQRLIDQQASFVANHIAGRDVLEIGSGEGRLAAALVARGYRVTSVEPDERHAAELEALGVRVIRSGWDGAAAQCPTRSFDAVVSIHSLEHLHDPATVLIECRALLRLTGVVIVEVPNVLAPYGDLDTWFFQHVHLYDFSPDTLAALLAMCGYRVREMQHSTPRLRALIAVAERAPIQTPEAPLGEMHGGHWVAGYLDRYRAEMRGQG